MTLDDLPVTPPPRPVDPLTSQDGIRLFSMIDGNMRKISSTLEELSNRLAINQKNDIKILEILNIIEEGLTSSRMGRLELEIKETERERDLAEAAYRAAQDKLNLKQIAKEGTQGTDERIKNAAKEAYTDIEKVKKQDREKWLEDLRRSIIKAVLISFAVSGSAGVVGFIWFLIQLYLNRAGP